jgi:hypothetical protein
MKSAKNILREGFASIPNDFAYREVKFHVYQAIQKLEKLEKREHAKEAQNQANIAAAEKSKRESVWMPPIYQNTVAVKQTLDILDKMIAGENKIIEDVRNKSKGQPQKNGNHYEAESDDQTLHG